MVLPITLTFAAVAAIVNLWLAARVSRLRVAGGHAMGDAGNPALLVRMRAHANFVEYTPFALILAGLIEAARGPSSGLWVAMALYLIGRIAHAIGMDRRAPNPFRMAGIGITWLVLLALALWAAAIAWSPAARPAAAPIETAPLRG